MDANEKNSRPRNRCDLALADLLEDAALSSSAPFPDFDALREKLASRAKRRRNLLTFAFGFAAVLTVGFFTGTWYGTPRHFSMEEGLVSYWTAPNVSVLHETSAANSFANSETLHQTVNSYIEYLWNSTSGVETQ
jgi:hypothetical protein